MNPGTILVFLALLAAVCVVVWGLVNQSPSILIAVIAAAVCILAALGAWYAWAESRSMPWTTGYGGLALLSAAATIRQRPRPSATRTP